MKTINQPHKYQGLFNLLANEHNLILTSEKMEEIIREVKLINKADQAKNTLQNNGFSIDFFELMFLAESVIPPRPIARSMCFDDFSEKHFHQMNDNQRKQFFEHVQKCYKFTLENEQCRHFFARFNPKNQYFVTCFHNGKAETIQCYMFDDEYRTSKNRFVNRDYIKKIIRIHDNMCIPK